MLVVKEDVKKLIFKSCFHIIMKFLMWLMTRQLNNYGTKCTPRECNSRFSMIHAHLFTNEYLIEIRILLTICDFNSVFSII